MYQSDERERREHNVGRESTHNFTIRLWPFLAPTQKPLYPIHVHILDAQPSLMAHRQLSMGNQRRQAGHAGVRCVSQQYKRSVLCSRLVERIATRYGAYRLQIPGKESLRTEVRA